MIFTNTCLWTRCCRDFPFLVYLKGQNRLFSSTIALVTSGKAIFKRVITVDLRIKNVGLINTGSIFRACLFFVLNKKCMGPWVASPHTIWNSNLHQRISGQSGIVTGEHSIDQKWIYANKKRKWKTTPAEQNRTWLCAIKLRNHL